jgi:soluble P-type ATPase
LAVFASVREIRIDHVLMVTGENDRVAQAVARGARIDDWRAGLLPEDKTEAVIGLRTTYGPIAMVGDGVNDAPCRRRDGRSLRSILVHLIQETAQHLWQMDFLRELTEGETGEEP